MMTITVPKAQLEAGFTCRVCKSTVPATPHFARRCPKCGQLYQSEGAAPTPAPTLGQA